MPNLRRTINRLKDPRDLWLFLQILSLLVRLPRLIKQKSLPDLLDYLDPGVNPVSPDEARLRKTVGFTDTLLRYRYFQKFGKCLMRSLCLFNLLRSQGWPVGIQFGVRRSGQGAFSTVPVDANDPYSITGHCWLTLRGSPFLEVEDTSRYAVTFTRDAGRVSDVNEHGAEVTGP